MSAVHLTPSNNTKIILAKTGLLSTKSLNSDIELYPSAKDGIEVVYRLKSGELNVDQLAGISGVVSNDVDLKLTRTLIDKVAFSDWDDSLAYLKSISIDD